MVFPIWYVFVVLLSVVVCVCVCDRVVSDFTYNYFFCARACVCMRVQFFLCKCGLKFTGNYFFLIFFRMIFLCVYIYIYVCCFFLHLCVCIIHVLFNVGLIFSLKGENRLNLFVDLSIVKCFFALKTYNENKNHVHTHTHTHTHTYIHTYIYICVYIYNACCIIYFPTFTVL